MVAPLSNNYNHFSRHVPISHRKELIEQAKKHYAAGKTDFRDYAKTFKIYPKEAVELIKILEQDEENIMMRL